jgi:uncharacterized protein (TIGR03067 family)
MTRQAFLLGLLSLALGAHATRAGAPKGGAGKDDLRKLAGNWVATHYEEGGTASPVKPGHPHRLTVAGNRFTLVHVLDVVGGTPVTDRNAGTLKLDPAKSPKEMDLAFTEGSDKGTTSPAIYELKGNELTVCIVPPNRPRPTEFKTKGVMILYKFNRAR